MRTEALVTAPTGQVVSIEEAKAQCNITGSDDDGYLNRIVTAAERTVESLTGRALLTQTWDIVFDGFPSGCLVLPKPPIASVTSLKYVDLGGTTQTWSSSNYRVQLPSGDYASRARIEPAYTVSWPSAREVIGAVTVRVVCGYGDAADVPEPLRHAVLMLVAHWHAQREPVRDASMGKVPLTIESLTWPFRV